MKTKKLKLLTILLFMLPLCVAFLCACDKEDNHSAEEKLSKLMNSAFSDIVLVEDMPNWLQLKTNDIEETPLIEAQVYECEWNNQTIYYVWNIFNSCVFCDVYDKDGIQVIWDDNNTVDEFMSKSKNWKMIWSFCDCEWKNN
jgi:hypothetical protein